MAQVYRYVFKSRCWTNEKSADVYVTKCAKRCITTYLAVLERTVDQIYLRISLYTRVYCSRDSTSIHDTYKVRRIAQKLVNRLQPVGLHVSGPWHLSSGQLYSTSIRFILLPPGNILLPPVIFYTSGRLYSTSARLFSTSDRLFLTSGQLYSTSANAQLSHTPNAHNWPSILFQFLSANRFLCAVYCIAWLPC
jgi:hypothetical protein